MTSQCVRRSGLPGKHRPHVPDDTFGSRNLIPAMQLQQGWFLGAADIPLCSGSGPCLLGPPIAPTAAALVRRAAGPFTPRNEPGITPRSCGIATCLMRATGTVGLAPTGLWPCRPLHIRRPLRTEVVRLPRDLLLRTLLQVVDPDVPDPTIDTVQSDTRTTRVQYEVTDGR